MESGRVNHLTVLLQCCVDYSGYFTFPYKIENLFVNITHILLKFTIMSQRYGKDHSIYWLIAELSEALGI